MKYDQTQALELLRKGSGSKSAVFRENQEDAIRHVVEGQGRLLVVQKTGWGKSFVYFIATKLLRDAGSGPALLISPLLSLMRNQIAAAERMGVTAATLNSENEEDWNAIEAQIAEDKVDILIISPERLANQRFRDQVLAGVAAKVSLLVIDEAHCISDWGHDFRPQYRLLERIVKTLPQNLRILATTATANNRVMNDLSAVLGPKLSIIKGDLNRESLTLQTITLPGQGERLAWLAERLGALQGSGIIYTLTVRDALQVTEWLKERGFSVEAYTGRTGDRREELELALLNNQVKALVATTALSMGYDKPDLAFVIHFQMPGSVVAYYQQVGRAGRALESAYGVLLKGEEDAQITNWFIQSAFPSENEINEVLKTLESAKSGLSVPELMNQLNLSKAAIEKTLLALSLESSPPIVKVGSKWMLTASALSPALRERAERLTKVRDEEHEQMRKYVELPFGQHMAFLIKALDGDPSTVKPPKLPPLPASADANMVIEAIAFLKRTNLPIQPRKKWPDGGMPKYQLKGAIPAELRAEEGMALCFYGDAGWGKLVKHGRYVEKAFGDELLFACVKMVKSWEMEPAPKWVTAMPSLRHPDLVPNFAKRLAQQLGLPFRPVLVKIAHSGEQKAMANSTQQAHNVDGSLQIDKSQLSSDAVILVDDIVHSRWSLTVASWLLRSSGSGAVWPLALSQTGNDE